MEQKCVIILMLLCRTAFLIITCLVTATLIPRKISGHSEAGKMAAILQKTRQNILLNVQICLFF